MIYPFITSVIVNTNYLLLLEFNTKEKKIFDVKPYLDKGIFSELKDYSYFSKVRVANGSITWENRQDFAPETLWLNSQPI